MAAEDFFAELREIATPHRPEEGDALRKRGARDYWRETLLTVTLALWVLLLLGERMIETVPILLLTGWMLWLAREHLGAWIYGGRIRRAWIHACYAVRIECPTVKAVEVTAVGDVLTVQVGRGGGTVQELTQRAERLGAHLDGWRSHVREVRIEPTGQASIATVTIIRRDPLVDIEPVPAPAPPGDVWKPTELGGNERGEPVYFTLAGHHLLLGGQTEGGKTVLMHQLIAAAAMDPRASLTILDGKEMDCLAWRDRCDRFVGDSMTEAIAALRYVQAWQRVNRERITAAGREKAEPGDPVHVLVIDELAEYTYGHGKQSTEFNTLLRSLVARGRAPGVSVIAATQIPYEKVVPTFIRNNIPYRIALRCTTPAASTTILGEGWAAAGYDASKIPQKQPGLGLMFVEGAEPQRFRARFMDLQAVKRIAANCPPAPQGTTQETIEANMAVQEATDPPATSRSRKQAPDALAALLPSEGEGMTRADWSALAGRGQWQYMADDVSALLERGAVVQSGSGVRGKPFRYRLAGPEGA